LCIVVYHIIIILDGVCECNTYFGEMRKFS
jgi:hypothetical protein